jgi:hypothetical protein
MHLDVFITTEADALRVMAFVRELGGSASPVVDVVEPDYSHLYENGHPRITEALEKASADRLANGGTSWDDTMREVWNA